MITEYFPNPNKKVFALPITYSAQTDRGVNGQSNVYNKYQAEKKGITTEEFARRDKLVRDKAKELEHGLYVGATVYPFSVAEYERLGPHRITQIYRTYADFETKDWDEHKWQYIVAAKRIDIPEYTTATAKYFVTKEPTV